MEAGKNIGVHRPAIITGVISENGICSLTVFPSAASDGVGHILCTSSTMHSEEIRPGTWHWPEREEVGSEGPEPSKAGGPNE